MFSFLKRKDDRNNEPEDPLYTDLHSHLLPGLDDGAATMEDSLAMLQTFQDLGFKRVITTPHVLEGHYNNTPEVIAAKLAEVRTAITEAGLTIHIDAGAEHFCDEGFTKKLLNKLPLLTFSDNYLLFETPFLNEPVNLKELIQEMLLQGYKPILAHPERYAWLTGNWEKTKQYHETGVFFQVNALSLIGQYDKPAQKMAEKLIDNEMLHFIGSDCHKMKHLDGYKAVMKTKYYRKALELSLLNRWL